MTSTPTTLQLDVVAANGVPFRIVYIPAGVAGPNPHRTPASSTRSTVEFYDARYSHTAPDGHGQFTGGYYYTETVLERSGGLTLDSGHSAAWSVDATTMDEVIRPWLRAAEGILGARCVSCGQHADTGECEGTEPAGGQHWRSDGAPLNGWRATLAADPLGDEDESVGECGACGGSTYNNGDERVCQDCNSTGDSAQDAQRLTIATLLARDERGGQSIDGLQGGKGFLSEIERLHLHAALEVLA